LGPHVEPERTCVGCRAKEQKGQLLRLAVSALGEVIPDPRGVVPGRGAYLHVGCVDAAIRKGGIARGLRLGLTSDVAVRLRDDIESMGAL
jgi:hypothetical protein